jgi:hypothetical protein
MSMNGGYVRRWKQAVMIYFKVPYYSSIHRDMETGSHGIFRVLYSPLLTPHGTSFYIVGENYHS